MAKEKTTVYMVVLSRNWAILGYYQGSEDSALEQASKEYDICEDDLTAYTPRTLPHDFWDDHDRGWDGL